jgi:hypothetical protein
VHSKGIMSTTPKAKRKDLERAVTALAERVHYLEVVVAHFLKAQQKKTEPAQDETLQ